MDAQSPKEQALKLLAQQRRMLAEQIKRLTADMDAISRAEEILSAQTNGHVDVPSALIPTGFEKLPAQEATLKLISEKPEKRWRAPEIKQQLFSQGFQTSSKNFANVLYTVLVRLIDKGEIEKIHENGLVFFKRKQKTA
jgi:hypothetical protein